MPYVNLKVTSGLTREQKLAVVKDITDSLVTNLGKTPETIHIVIDEVEEQNWGFAGMLTDDWKKQK